MIKDSDYNLSETLCLLCETLCDNYNTETLRESQRTTEDLFYNYSFHYFLQLKFLIIIKISVKPCLRLAGLCVLCETLCDNYYTEQLKEA